LLAGVSAMALALLVWLKIYPVSMIGVPGQTIDNTTPPTVALLAFGCAQTGIAIAVAPSLNRALRGMRVERALSIANSNIMALYLWHMIPVVIVAIVGYPAGLLPQPPEGSADWWLARLEWVAVLSVVAAVEIALLFGARKLFAAPLPLLGVPLTERWAEPVMLAGAAMAAYALSVIAAEGFAPDGRFPWLTAGIFVVGALLAAVRPARQNAPLAQGAQRERNA
jgi:hypothetical protein